MRPRSRITYRGFVLCWKKTRRFEKFSNAIVQTVTLGTGDAYKTEDVVDGPEFEVMGGYQWVLKSGINVDCNFGLSMYQQFSRVIDLTTGSTDTYSSRTWKVMPVIEANVGYAF